MCAVNMIAELDRDPSIDIISLAPNDGGGFCMCETCASLDKDRDWWATYSDRLAPFNNAVAKIVGKTYPDVLIKVGAYALYVRYPADPDYVPEPNLAYQTCHTITPMRITAMTTAISLILDAPLPSVGTLSSVAPVSGPRPSASVLTGTSSPVIASSLCNGNDCLHPGKGYPPTIAGTILN